MITNSTFSTNIKVNVTIILISPSSKTKNLNLKMIFVICGMGAVMFVDKIITRDLLFLFNFCKYSLGSGLVGDWGWLIELHLCQKLIFGEENYRLSKNGSAVAQW